DSLEWLSLFEIVGCLWFNRLRVVQEVVVAKYALAMWANAKIEWMEIAETVFQLQFYCPSITIPLRKVPFRHLEQISELYLMRIGHITDGDHPSFIDVLSMTRAIQCSDIILDYTNLSKANRRR
ncbi:hypothetical protein K469DRAFT_572297, partial [Zopfia rhizophila CBS 207.26]